jgi:hypothetical protein
MLLVMSHQQQLGMWRSGWAISFVHVLWLLVLLPIKLSTAAIARGQVLGIYVLQQLAGIAACTQHTRCRQQWPAQVYILDSQQ